MPDNKLMYCLAPDTRDAFLNDMIDLAPTQEATAARYLAMVSAFNSIKPITIFPMPETSVSASAVHDPNRLPKSNSFDFDRFEMLESIILRNAGTNLSGMDFVLLMVLISNSVIQAAGDAAALQCRIAYTMLHTQMEKLGHGSQGAIRKRIQTLQKNGVLIRLAGGVGKENAEWSIPFKPEVNNA